MGTIWFTADTHFAHKNIIKHCNRPFESVDEMEEVLVANWNERVKKGDTVYHLGDFAWADAEHNLSRLLGRLNGQVHLIMGNHDRPSKVTPAGFASVSMLGYTRYQKQKIMMCHYSMRVWRSSHYGSWMLYGHSHGSLEDIGGKTMDVGIDAHNYYPICFEQIWALMELRDPHVVDHHRIEEEDARDQ